MCSDYVTVAGESARIRFHAPEGGGTYYCEPRRAQGMEGILSVQGHAAPAPAADAEASDDPSESPGVGVLALVTALGAAAALLRRRD